jgi:hypothetical protein
MSANRNGTGLFQLLSLARRLQSLSVVRPAIFLDAQGSLAPLVSLTSLTLADVDVHVLQEFPPALVSLTIKHVRVAPDGDTFGQSVTWRALLSLGRLASLEIHIRLDAGLLADLARQLPRLENLVCDGVTLPKEVSATARFEDNTGNDWRSTDWREVGGLYTRTFSSTRLTLDATTLSDLGRLSRIKVRSGSHAMEASACAALLLHAITVPMPESALLAGEKWWADSALRLPPSVSLVGVCLREWRTCLPIPIQRFYHGRYCPLMTLRLTHADLTPSGVARLAHLYAPNLETLDLSHNPRLVDPSPLVAFSASLTSLSLADCALPYDAVLLPRNNDGVRRRFDRLTELDLSGNRGPYPSLLYDQAPAIAVLRVPSRCSLHGLQRLDRLAVLDLFSMPSEASSSGGDGDDDTDNLPSGRSATGENASVRGIRSFGPFDLKSWLGSRAADLLVHPNLVSRARRPRRKLPAFARVRARCKSRSEFARITFPTRCAAQTRLKTVWLPRGLEDASVDCWPWTSACSHPWCARKIRVRLAATLKCES